jgi:hypothetical protein
MSMSTSDRSVPAQGSSVKDTTDGQETKTAGKGKGKSSEREVDSEGKPVLPWAFIDCDTDDLVVLIGESSVVMSGTLQRKLSLRALARACHRNPN